MLITAVSSKRADSWLGGLPAQEQGLYATGAFRNLLESGSKNRLLAESE